MHSIYRLPRSERGSALLTVVLLTAVMAILTASMLSYTLTERRGNERNRLILRAKNTAENISLYAAEQISAKLYRTRSSSPMAFMTGSNQVHLPPASVLDSAFTSATNGMEVRAGLVSATGLTFINPATNPGNANAGLQVNTCSVPIISKATATHPALGNIVAYTRNDLAVDLVPLFQFAIFYNMDLEFSPGADMVIAGPVHTNGNLIARCQTGFTNTVQFTDRVSASQGFYANTAHKGSTYMDDGSADSGPGGTGPLNFQHSTSGTVTNIKSSSTWRDHKYGGSSETTTSQNNFKVFATNTYGINLRTSVHGVTNLLLPDVADYSETDDPSTDSVDERDNGRQIIEPPSTDDTAGLMQTKIARKAGLYIVVNPDDTVRTGVKPDGNSVTMLGHSYRCWLNTVNSDGSQTITEVVLPGQPSYGYNNNGTPTDPTDDFMYVNNLPNRFRTDTSIGHNQVLRIPQQDYAKVKRYDGGSWVATDAATLPNGAGYAHTIGSPPTYPNLVDAYFYDMRRANGNRGYPFGRSATNPYTPRPIAKIDLDMVRFRMAVERTLSGTPGSIVASATTSSIYYPGQPTTSALWSDSIFNPSASRDNFGLGLGASAYTTLPTTTTLAAPDPYRIYVAPSDPSDITTITTIATTPGNYAAGAANLVTTSGDSPWFDGITIYVHSVDAETRTQSSGVPVRVDSGVRLINGRGPIVSLSSASYPGRTGFSFGTNDAVYVLGHFNADGSINSTKTSTTNPGGYSARYPDSSSEMLCSVFGDAITILSQPVFSSSGSHAQTSGWSDSLSAHRRDTTFAWSSSWRTTNPSSTNRQDGINSSTVPSAMPTYQVAGSGSSMTSKFDPSVTEISAAFLLGIVPTNHNPTGLTDGAPSTSANGQTSGGVHNYPRLSEDWNGTGLYIRGSMVAMFESRVAMEPWSLRVYSGAGRYWGLHETLRTVNHDLPLEPMLINARRLGFREISAAEYAATKATIEALPH
ncbi:MAG: hypothetical protein KF897_09950 [Opitutaceae bacterium]|nr:hypothetical protein [Opitutaceae bacterium]